MSTKLPVLFLSHGAGPASMLNYAGDSMFAGIDKSSPSAAFMRSLSSFIPGSIRNILVISAHWEEKQFTVGYQTNGTKLLYDYGGFPKESYAPFLTYPAPTDLQLADRVHDLLTQAGLPCVKMERGYDHGVFIPMKAAYPEANIPIVQISLKNNLNISDHIRLGEILSPLRSEGTLIVCSGQITHNLRDIGVNDNRAVDFMQWIRSNLEGATGENYGELREKFVNIEKGCPLYRWAHPREEHFTPLFVALGASRPSNDQNKESGEQGECASGGVKAIYEEVLLGSMGVQHFMFTM